MRDYYNGCRTMHISKNFPQPISELQNLANKEPYYMAYRMLIYFSIGLDY